MIDIETEEKVCVCKFPIWMYDGNGKEYFAIPVKVAEEKGIQKIPEDLIIDVDIDGKDVKFLAIPFETVQTRGIEIPDIDIVDYDIPIGHNLHNDGDDLDHHDTLTKQFTKVTWKKVAKDDFTKKYELKGHIVVAGCKHSDALKDKYFDELDGKEKLYCSEKEIFSVLHPMEEFLEDHIGEIEDNRNAE